MPICPAVAGLRVLFVTAAYEKYASFLTITRALHLYVFEQPAAWMGKAI
jgi:hypothetical protein